jgi:RNA polymerase sigma-70 factor, ECF subfamily
MTLDEEIALIGRAKQGDMDAFESLYTMHKIAIYRATLAIVGDKQSSEEILQETFLRAFKHIQKFHEGTSLAPWLYRVAINLAYDWSARRRRWLAALDGIVERLVGPAVVSPEQSVERRELQELVYEAIGKLDFKQRTALVLFYLHSLSLAEIAVIQDCPVGTVKSRLHYARNNLKRELLADQRLAGGLVYEFT